MPQAKVLTLVLFLLLSLSASAQEKYDFGKIDEIKGMSKVFVSGEPGDRKAIVKEIDGKAGLVVVDDVEKAEFFILFEFTGVDRIGFSSFRRGQIHVYLKAGDRRRAVWTKDASRGLPGSGVAKLLANQFLKDFQKIGKSS